MIDPMLATGGSAVSALDLLRNAGARNVRMICIVAAPEGIALVERHHPDVHIFTPVVDQGSTNTSSSSPASATSAIGCTARSNRQEPRHETADTDSVTVERRSQARVTDAMAHGTHRHRAEQDSASGAIRSTR